MEEEVEEEVEQAVPSLLEKLRSPTSSTLARKRKLTKNKPPTGCKNHVTFDYIPTQCTYAMLKGIF